MHSKSKQQQKTLKMCAVFWALLDPVLGEFAAIRKNAAGAARGHNELSGCVLALLVRMRPSVETPSGHPRNNHYSHGFRTWQTWPWPPKPIMFDFGDTKLLQIVREENRIIVGKYRFWKGQHFGHLNFWKFWKSRGPNNPEDLFNKFLKILEVESISI